MAHEEQEQSFGIENTMSLDDAGMGNTKLLDSLYETEGDPDKVKPIDNEEDKTAAEVEDTSKKEEEDVPDKTAKSPEALTNFLLGEEKEVDEIEKEDPVDTKKEGIVEKAPLAEEKKEEDSDFDAQALSNDLFSIGVFTKNEGEEEVKIETPEDLAERFTAEKQKGAQEILTNFLGQFGQDYQDAFDAIYVKGVDPKEYFGSAAAIETFSNLDLTNENNQEKIVRQALADLEYDPEDIDSEVEKLKNYGDLEESSKRHHKVLLKKEQKGLAAKQQVAEQENKNKQFQKDTYVNNVRSVLAEKLKAKEFDGIPLNMQTANELQDFLLVDKWKTESGETLTDFDRQILDLKRPENHADKVKIALLLKLLEKDPTLSTVQKRGVSKKSSALFKEVARQKTTSKREVATSEPAVSWFKK